MIICSRCGTQNPPSAEVCGLCGIALPYGEKPRERPAGPSLSRTMVGQGPLMVIHPRASREHETMATPPGPADESARAAAVAQPPVDPPAHGATAAHKPVGRHATMVGIAPPSPVFPQQQDPPPPDPGDSAEAQPDAPRTVRMNLMNRTVIGLAPPAPVVSSGTLGTPSDARPVEPPKNSDVHVRPNLPPQVKTMLGVARPGIAPVHPGLPKPEPAPEVPSSRGPPSVAPESRRRPPPRTRAAALAALTGAGLLLGAGGFVYFFFLRGPGPIEGRASIDPNGRDRLELACPNCEDGTRARVGAQVVRFQAGRAALALASPLQIGENRFELGVSAKDSSRERNVSLLVPLEFRVRGDTSTLAEAVPRLRILIEALPKSRLIVDTKPLGLDPQGRAEFSIDVSGELQGAEAGVTRIERKISYSIAPPLGEASQGTIEFRIGIVPLVLDAPGESITTEEATFVLAGRTQRGATLSIGERALAIDAEGRFAQTMSVSALGETTVTLRATAEDHAPRLYPIRVRRVASLADEARALRATSTGSFAAIDIDIPKKRGWKVALDGTVIEVSTAAHRTLLLLDTKSGCKKPQCIARVLYGRHSTFRAGDSVSVFGRVQGEVEGPRSGSKIPEIVADFLLRTKR